MKSKIRSLFSAGILVLGTVPAMAKTIAAPPSTGVAVQVQELIHAGIKTMQSICTDQFATLGSCRSLPTVVRFVSDNPSRYRIIESTDLKGPDNQPRTALNNRKDTIWIDPILWRQLVEQGTEASVVQLALHELFSLMQLEESDRYTVSSQWVDDFNRYGMYLRQLVEASKPTASETVAFWIKGKKDYHGTRWWIGVAVVGTSAALLVPVAPALGGLTLLAGAMGTKIFFEAKKNGENPEFWRSPRWSPLQVEQEKARLEFVCREQLAKVFTQGVWAADYSSITSDGFRYRCGVPSGRISKRNSSTRYAIPVLKEKVQ